MKTFIIIVILVLVVVGLLLVGKKGNVKGVMTEADIAEIEKKKAAEPTVEESMEAQFGISEEDAEARYSAEMQ